MESKLEKLLFKVGTGLTLAGTSFMATVIGCGAVIASNPCAYSSPLFCESTLEKVYFPIGLVGVFTGTLFLVVSDYIHKKKASPNSYSSPQSLERESFQMHVLRHRPPFG